MVFEILQYIRAGLVCMIGVAVIFVVLDTIAINQWDAIMPGSRDEIAVGSLLDMR